MVNIPATFHRLADNMWLPALPFYTIQEESRLMIQTYIETAMRHAIYEMIQDDEPYYGEIPELLGVWASGRTLEECRQNLIEAVDGWLLFRVSRGMDIPAFDTVRLTIPQEMAFA